MFRSPIPVTPLLVSCLLACFVATGCTNSSCIPSWALLIKAKSAGTPVDADSVMVRFDDGDPYECPAVADRVGEYTCAGNANGTYVVTVQLGGVARTQSAELDADVCGVIDPQQLDFAFGAPAAPNTDDAGAN